MVFSNKQKKNQKKRRKQRDRELQKRRQLKQKDVNTAKTTQGKGNRDKYSGNNKAIYKSQSKLGETKHHIILRITTWNVRGLSEKGREVIQEFDRAKLDIYR